MVRRLRIPKLFLRLLAVLIRRRFHIFLASLCAIIFFWGCPMIHKHSNTRFTMVLWRPIFPPLKTVWIRLLDRAVSNFPAVKFSALLPRACLFAIPNFWFLTICLLRWMSKPSAFSGSAFLNTAGRPVSWFLTAAPRFAAQIKLSFSKMVVSRAWGRWTSCSNRVRRCGSCGISGESIRRWTQMDADERRKCR